MSSPADDPFHTVQQLRPPASEPTADPVPADDADARAADLPPADPYRTTVRPSAAPADPSVDGYVNVTQLDGTHPVPSVPPPASDSVPGYEILGELGRGGMGVVYQARHLKLNRPVALKMVLGGIPRRASYLIRFLAEAEAVAAVEHPNVVEVYEYGEADGRPFLALEFCPGGSLADRLATRRESAPSAAPRARSRRWSGRWPRGGGGPRPGDRPPGPEAGQRAAGRGRGAEGGRLRAGQAGGRGGPDPGRGRGRDAGVHGPGAGRAARASSSARRPTCGRSASSCTRR